MKKTIKLVVILILLNSIIGCGSAKSGEEYNATFSIDCKTILDNMDILNNNKVQAIPADGIIMARTEVVFYEGESVFDVLKRETVANKIHLEFSLTPIHNAAYIEGIGNIYEFDCGNLSGWSYLVNGDSLGYSSSEYKLKDGDVVEWRYSCDLGIDTSEQSDIK